jgi:hypothetical protein
VVSWIGYIGFSAGDGRKLVVELLEDGFVGVYFVEEVLGLEISVISIGEVSWVDN